MLYGNREQVLHPSKSAVSAHAPRQAIVTLNIVAVSCLLFTIVILQNFEEQCPPKTLWMFALVNNHSSA